MTVRLLGMLLMCLSGSAVFGAEPDIVFGDQESGAIAERCVDPSHDQLLTAEPPDEPEGFAVVAERLNFRRDVSTAPVWLGQDLRSLASWENAGFLGVATGATLLVRSHVDGRVADEIAQNGSHWGGVSRALNQAGEPIVHVPLLAGFYSYTLYTQNEDLHELSLTLLGSYKFAAIGSLALQFATGTRHGTHDSLSLDNGFPSIPASSSFAMAAVIEEKYGWKAGLPAYVGAGLIGWSGVDQQEHRVSDVVFGAALGYVIGKSIGALHYRQDDRFTLVPFVDVVTGAQGLGFVQQY